MALCHIDRGYHFGFALSKTFTFVLMLTFFTQFKIPYQRYLKTRTNTKYNTLEDQCECRKKNKFKKIFQTPTDYCFAQDAAPN